MEYICSDCPRKCSAYRSDDSPGGFCASPALPRIARAAPHYGEEPCLSGTRGAGTIFFSGCNLRCVYCQNAEISRGLSGRRITVPMLQKLMLQLRDRGVHCIDLVTPTHYARTIASALDGLELGIPVVWNSSGYECLETLRMLEGLVQIFLPDLKYLSPESGRRFSAAPNYGAVAAEAIMEMVRQRGRPVFDGDGILQSGVLIRHLILPGAVEESRNVIDFVADHFLPGEVLFSLMSQYTPMPGAESVAPELGRRVTDEENAAVIHYMKARGVTDGYWQETDSAGADEIPDFDGGLLNFVGDTQKKH